MFVVTKVKASDRDGGRWGKVTYSISGIGASPPDVGASVGTFVITSGTSVGTFVGTSSAIRNPGAAESSSPQHNRNVFHERKRYAENVFVNNVESSTDAMLRIANDEPVSVRDQLTITNLKNTATNRTVDIRSTDSKINDIRLKVTRNNEAEYSATSDSASDEDLFARWTKPNNSSGYDHLPAFAINPNNGTVYVIKVSSLALGFSP